MGAIGTKRRKDEISRSATFPQVPKMCFGFSYVSSNKHYGLTACGERKVYEDLLVKLCELSHFSLSDAIRMNKQQGMEWIPYQELSKPMQQVCDHTSIVASDAKLIVFRFAKGKCRLICQKDDVHGNLMHIIAFDTDLSAYNHG